MEAYRELVAIQYSEGYKQRALKSCERSLACKTHYTHPHIIYYQCVLIFELELDQLPDTAVHNHVSMSQRQAQVIELASNYLAHSCHQSHRNTNRTNTQAQEAVLNRLYILYIRGRILMQSCTNSRSKALADYLDICSITRTYRDVLVRIAEIYFLQHNLPLARQFIDEA
jgi:hypothetical protein